MFEYTEVGPGALRQQLIEHLCGVVNKANRSEVKDGKIEGLKVTTHCTYWVEKGNKSHIIKKLL